MKVMYDIMTCGISNGVGGSYANKEYMTGTYLNTLGKMGEIYLNDIDL
jgi:hypothetical protein